MSVYNDGHYVSQAVESILSQSFQNFEFVIVDDGCTDNTREVISRYDDPRIRVMVNRHNLGLARSLNDAIRHSRGDYIARQDADDISLPDRLRREVACLEGRPDICMVGSSAIVVGDDGAPRGYWPVLCRDVDLKWSLLFDNPFIHSSVMLRRSVLERAGLYSDEAQSFVEDYDLWSRMNRISRSTNLSTPLLKYRQNPASVSKRATEEQLFQSGLISKRNIRWVMGVRELDPVTWARLQSVRLGLELSSVHIRETLVFLEALREAFYTSHGFSALEASSHRARTYWQWAEYALRLVCRRTDGDGGSRLTLLGYSSKLLTKAVAARFG